MIRESSLAAAVALTDVITCLYVPGITVTHPSLPFCHGARDITLGVPVTVHFTYDNASSAQFNALSPEGCHRSPPEPTGTRTGTR